MNTKITLMISLLLCFLFSKPLWAKNSLAIKGGAQLFSLTGTDYKEYNEVIEVFSGSFSYHYSQNWRLSASASMNFTGEFFSSGLGGYYHIFPYTNIEEQFSREVVIVQSYKWSPYLGLELNLLRSQVSLQLVNNSIESDVILASILGPTIHGGFYYSITNSTRLIFDVFAYFGFSSKVTASQVGATVGVSFLFPE